jgi:hypothetical protein
MATPSPNRGSPRSVLSLQHRNGDRQLRRHHRKPISIRINHI